MNRKVLILTLIALLTACGQAGQKQSAAKPDNESADTLIIAETPMNLTTETERSAESNTVPSGVITNRGVDEFVVGNPIPSSSVKYAVQKRMKMVEEGNEEPYYTVLEHEKEIVYLDPKYDDETEQYINHIRVIGIVSEKYKTLENIGVHSTIEEFITQYPDFDIWYTIVGGMYVIQTPHYENVQFLLDEKGFIGELDIEGLITPLKHDDFKPNTKIVQIRIY
jgi:hypothetical protein